MSIDIDWESLTTGPEGLELAESIRDFIHEKFQQVELPRFIRSVQVHSFDFGEECPVVELKDICDPLPEFYAHDEEVDEEEEEIGASPREPSLQPVRSPAVPRPNNDSTTSSTHTHHPPYIDTRLPGLRLNLGHHTDHRSTPFLSRSNTPGIPGGTSNLSYFHLPLSAGLSTGGGGAQTPLAAVAGGSNYAAGLHHASRQQSPVRQQQQQDQYPDNLRYYNDPSSRPSTADSYHTRSISHPPNASNPENTSSSPAHDQPHTPSPQDLQIVLHISYSGTLALSITAEILLDYPMPSFVGIPLKLNITGLSFDGVALLAYLRKRTHFCFLGTEDAQTLVGGGQATHGGGDRGVDKLGSLLREIRVESEIGRKEGGKQSLKNVGKVEKFVLEQVRRIFEDEFVWPSFWTFLV